MTPAEAADRLGVIRALDPVFASAESRAAIDLARDVLWGERGPGAPDPQNPLHAPYVDAHRLLVDRLGQLVLDWAGHIADREMHTRIVRHSSYGPDAHDFGTGTRSAAAAEVRGWVMELLDVHPRFLPPTP